MVEGGAILLRDAGNADAAAIIELIAAAYAEYPGCVLDLEADMPELKAPASSYAQIAGKFWVAQGVAEAARILGCVACQPAPEGGLELEKLYVARGARLLDLVEAEAVARQAGAIALWTDTRFEAAHAFYAARGFRRTGQRRLDDASKSVETSFRKDL